jgi:hypothetical protein
MNGRKNRNNYPKLAFSLKMTLSLTILIVNFLILSGAYFLAPPEFRIPAVFLVSFIVLLLTGKLYTLWKEY